MLRNLLTASDDDALHHHLALLAMLHAFSSGRATLAVSWVGVLTMPNLVQSLCSFTCRLERLASVVVADRDTAPSAILCATSNADEVLAVGIS